MRCITVIVFYALVTLGLGAQKTFWDCPKDATSQGCCRSTELTNGCVCFKKPSFWSFFQVVTQLLSPIPSCPKDLGVDFFLYTRSHRNMSKKIKADDSSISKSEFNPSRPTKFIIHGYQDKGPVHWSKKMKNELLDKEDLNVIIVNWEKGANTFVYPKAAANVRSVGAMIAQLIRVLYQRHGAKLLHFHLIGHSLGAHLSGMAGKEIQRVTNASIGRISGLDPANVKFENKDKHERLDSTDADFVDVIHTDAGNVFSNDFGIKKEIGDVDFYPNGGNHQPACKKDTAGIFTVLDKGVHELICSHMIVLDYFTKSIINCNYPTSDPNCKMGYNVSPNCKGTFKFDFNTTQTPIHCQEKDENADWPSFTSIINKKLG